MTDLKKQIKPMDETPTEIDIDHTRWNRWYIFVLMANVFYVLIFLLVKMMNQ